MAAYVEPSSPNAASFGETLQYRATQTRRARPPDLESVAGDHRRIPLRSENRLSRRESKLGLKSIFGKGKGVREINTTASYFDTGRPNSIRASLAEISNWSYTRSEIALPTAHSRPTSRATNSPFNDFPPQKRPTHAERPKPHNAAVRWSRGNLATWDPPPLFQAYPQAIKHAQLPAATTSADVILRLTDRKGSISLRDDLTQLALTPELAEEQLADRAVERARRKHLRTLSTTRLEWTTKSYVLCTSGFLLQYAGEGSFDRLPEKVLHLSRDSAAFVSDAIPGRHWVLQVSSNTEPNGATSSDSRSLLSRLPFRAADKRHAANFLMVFESAEEMELWITILRREIEALGGKKNLSETGKPKSADEAAQLKGRASQRTLVVRDRDRFSRVLPPDFCLQLEQSKLHDYENRSTLDVEMRRDSSIDDISTTNSVISHDDRQLENLRDSTNRLSHISSGQRTFLTSAGSSPACSPVRDSFASSHLDESPAPVHETPVVRPRPNAAAILDRRQSLQTSGYLELRGSPMSRPQSTFAESDFAQVAANFSVPISRRYSAVKSPSSSPEQTRNRDSIVRIARKPPPTALAMARPLSIVADQPSPVKSVDILESPAPVLAMARPLSIVADQPSPVKSVDTLESPATALSQVTEERPTSQTDTAAAFPPRQASLGPKEQAATVTVRTSPRRHASSPSLSQPEASPLPELRTFILPSRSTPPPPSSEASREVPCQVDVVEEPPSPVVKTSRAAKRLSRYFAPSPADIDGVVPPLPPLPPPPKVIPVSPKSLPQASPRTPKTPPTPSTKHLSVLSVQTKCNLNRRSMPQLADGPPPAPPPSYALPPIPQKTRS
ncbi:hypothetical protein CCHL11_01246 [Colletotrichum chlorophyti]|uniref:PH domain-containing protein n=1 Tax=Colletotrichum chlorophyti TaxID=708187 RepID=A0A1Q8S876_9PEZI|nr:hypothetical protein CCHL11_01246 [Colletotrichum chlorophyti]